MNDLATRNRIWAMVYLCESGQDELLAEYGRRLMEEWA